MGIAAGIKDIAKDITSSYNVRMAEVKGLKKEAAEMLGSAEASRGEMGAQLRQDLAHDKAKMGAKVKAMRNGFQNSHKKMSSALKKDLAEHTQEVRGEAQDMIKSFEDSREEANRQLRKDLARDNAGMGAKVKTMRNGFQSSHKKMSSALKKDLADHNRAVKDEAFKMRQETIADLMEARAAWQGLASNMQAKRGGTKTPPKVAAPAANEENPDLEAKLLAAIGKYPAGGITLADLANILGVAPVVLGRVSKSLMKKGKIHKKEMLYFPVSAK